MTAESLASLLKKDPRLVRVLHAYGIEVCAGCILTLTAPLHKAAAYHGVPDVPAFLRAVKARSSKRRHKKR